MSVLGSYTLIVAPIGVKFGAEEGTSTSRLCEQKTLKSVTE